MTKLEKNLVRRVGDLVVEVRPAGVCLSRYRRSTKPTRTLFASWDAIARTASLFVPLDQHESARRDLIQVTGKLSTDH